MLQVVNLPFVSARQCARTVPKVRADTSQVCAGEKGKDSCNGDSGGPLMVFDAVGEVRASKSAVSTVLANVGI